MIDWSQKITPASRAAAAREAMALSRARFAIAVMDAGIVTPDEAEAWADGSALPAALVALINHLPAGRDRVAARIEAKAAIEIRRTHPLVIGLGQAFGLSDAQVDALFGGPAAP